jgi:hypothetical protein
MEERRMTWLVPWLLFAHVIGAIVAFGPTFAMPLIGRMGGQEPMHANFAARISLAIEERITIPLAFVQGLTGILLIWAASIDVMSATWLLVGVTLYVIALGFALFVQAPTAKRVVELSTMPAGGPPPGAPAGPPPELLASVKKVQRGGMLLSVLIVVIVILMVVKPMA